MTDPVPLPDKRRPGRPKGKRPFGQKGVKCPYVKQSSYWEERHDRGIKDRRARKKTRTRLRNIRKLYGREAVLCVLNWAYARYCDGNNYTKKLRPNLKKTNWITPTPTGRRDWTGKVFRCACKLVDERLSMEHDVKQGRDTPTAIAAGKVDRPQEFWRRVAQWIFLNYYKEGEWPSIKSLQERIGFELMEGSRPV